MIEGIRTIGEAVLQKNPSIVEALIREEEVPEGQKRYVVHLNVQLEPLALEVSAKELDYKVLAEVLWVGNAPASNDPQDRLTTDHVQYLVSQTVPNLMNGLPAGALRDKLEELQQAVYIDLGERSELFSEGGDAQYHRYRRLWDLHKLGLARLELIEDPEEREELEGLCQQHPFLTKPFLQEYARQKGSAKAAVELVGSVVEAWVLQQLDIKRREVALYTLQVDGNLLAQHQDYRAYIAKTLVDEAFEDAPEGICHVCGRQGPVTKDMTRFKLLKFYITDKPGFASELRDTGFFRNYVLCQHCYRALLAGERFAENQLRTQLARSSVYVIPVFHVPSIQPTAHTLERWAEYLQTRLAATRTLEEWQRFQKNLEDYEDYQEFENAKASFVLNLLFATKAQGAVKVDKLVQDVPPSRLDQLEVIRNQVWDTAKGYLGESREWDLSLGRIFYLFPIRKQGNQAQTRPFLEFLETLLTGRSVQVQFLIPEFLETACVHYFERYGAYVQTSPGQDRQAVDRALAVFLLQSQLLLHYLKALGQLEGIQGGELMDIESQALEEPLQSYLEELGLDRGRRGLFLLGYLIGRIGSTPEQRRSNKPILNKVHFQGMDPGKIMRLSNEVYEKLRQYKIAEYNEATYAAMKALLDREHKSLDSPQENTYWVLSGYAYATWQAIRAGKLKHEASEEQTPQEV
uniref:CRISPR-associated Csh1 family protein n=1 Tax=uncultured prokaryote TaxID=198431 RepID=H5S985_9ZZZZ|nr:CRISPR-associated Csh1 family protein [uncultured prokaryote]